MGKTINTGGFVFFLTGVSKISFKKDHFQLKGILGKRTFKYPSISSPITLKKNLLFRSIQSDGFSLNFLRTTTAKQIATVLEEHRTDYWRPILFHKFTLLQDTAKLFALWLCEQKRYVRKSYLELFLAESDARRDLVRYEEDFGLLGFKINDEIGESLSLLRDPEAWRSDWNHRWCHTQLAKNRDWFDGLEKHPMTEAQRNACVVDEDAVLVLAGAGTGKTSTMKAKTAYLVRAGLARPEEILLLAFGKDARDELAERVHTIPGLERVEVSTFHAMGKRIVDLVRGKRTDVTVLATDDQQMTKFIDKSIETLRADKDFQDNLTKYFGGYLYPFPNILDFDNNGEYFEYLRVHNIRALGGELVKSFEELQIANYLYLNGIKYEYEPKYPHDTATRDKCPYHPDFYLPELDVYVEHFGVDEKGNTAPYIDTQAYREGMAWKRQTHQAFGTYMIETYSYEAKRVLLGEVLEDKLANFCSKRGLSLNRFKHKVVAEEIFKQLRKLGQWSVFSKLMSDFINVFKGSPYELEQLEALPIESLNDLRFQAFLPLFRKVYEHYESLLRANETMDFNDMIREAVRHVKAGNYLSPYKYIMVDEFQDIAPLRADLVKVLLAQQSDCALFCVGDDWQTIYRFAGSDVTLTTEFSRHFSAVEQVVLDKTFRFNDRICGVASRFIQSNQSQIRKQIETIEHSTQTEVHVVIRAHRNTALDEALSDIDRQVKIGGRASVFLLARFNHSRPDMLGLKQRYQNLDLTFMSVHKAKGSEADCVVVLDVIKDRFGFPSLVKNDPIIEKVLPTAERFRYAEERRLFYVAMTRARRTVYLLTEPNKESLFIKELKQDDYDVSFDRGELDREIIETVHCPGCLEGLLELAVSGERRYYRCSLWPYCKETAAICPKCGIAPLVRDAELHVCANPDCRYSELVCPKCGRGRLLKRKGPYGCFLGCSLYKKDGGAMSCDYTKRIKNTDVMSR